MLISLFCCAAYLTASFANSPVFHRLRHASETVAMLAKLRKSANYLLMEIDDTCTRAGGNTTRRPYASKSFVTLFVMAKVECESMKLLAEIAPAEFDVLH
ncbi:hypothetical protein BRYFOR_06904 [Marvinbryantia formatexigens DSM 14469]|uniref:Secreted protein n=2 Tax=Marvinbryantia TaxID=248744 RepID=C6LE55_9FIRM|nr:hypothetical protein BRYFOR_06904 [Marvinbryantia formatexigens DSM 14469]